MQIFVAHDFRKLPLRNYRRPFRVLGERHKVDFKFADEALEADHLLEQIEKLIDQSDFCLFDVSRWNRNVMFELGFARGRTKHHCLLFRPTAGVLSRWGFREGFADLPTDVKGLKYIQYTNEYSLRFQLDDLLGKLLRGADLSRTQDVLTTRVEGLIAQHPNGVTNREIAVHLKIDNELASVTTRKLVQAGRVERVGRRYRKVNGSSTPQAAA